MTNGRFLWLFLFLLAGFTVWWSWQQTASHPQILYLGWDDSDQVQIFVADSMATNEPRQLTDIPATAALFDFAVEPNGKQIAYSLLETTGGSSIWLMDKNGRSATQLHRCPQSHCTDLVWHPREPRLLFEQRDSEASPPYLWWLDTATGQTAPLLADNEQPGMAARFAPHTDWVSYVSLRDDGVLLYNFATGEDSFAASIIGSPAAWQPTETAVIVSDLDVAILHGGEEAAHDEHGHETSEAIHLYKVDVATGARLRLTDAANVDDGTAVWSPNGEWIAFGRKLIKTAVGRQLWLVRADGSEAHALTDTPHLHHGPPRWSPDGSTLLFQRFDSESGGGKSAVLTLNIATGEQTEIASTGMQPVWLP